ncbi:MAG: DUF3298 and DUF4163 domain-containing protein [Firmicutes bacterium]|nr:DUF3298 and DUF4163 domain-containing protein [Bacillota bacterium]
MNRKEYLKYQYNYHKYISKQYNRLANYHMSISNIYNNKLFRKVNTNEVNIVTKKIEKPNIEVRYPQITNLENKLVEQQLNKKLKSRAISLMEDQERDQYNLVYMDASYNVKLNEKKLLSIYFNNYGYSKGAAHGGMLTNSITLDIKSGKEYEIKDLFKPNANFKKRLSDIIKKQIKEKDIYLLGEFESINDNQDYYLTNDKLVIYFQVYEYTPYAYGIPKFDIDYNLISDIIDMKGPIGRLI